MFIIECFSNFKTTMKMKMKKSIKIGGRKSLTSSFEGSLIQKTEEVCMYMQVWSRSLPMATKYFLD